ncbi:hypothetical protein [Streptomyces sp. NPDC057257]|uniref:hypothetical protein n=1 Tax=Streptomyces sp. NPDC057257 TaxID=3346071 RepID=UPI00362B7318
MTPAHLHAVALEAGSTVLLQVPAGHGADWAGYAEAPTRSTYAVTGRRFDAVAKDGSALVVGDDGVSLTVRERDGSDAAVTVPYRACAAMLSRPDGGRRLIGADGLAVAVEPGLHGVDAHTMAALDAAVPPHAPVQLPPRQRVRARRPLWRRGTPRPRPPRRPPGAPEDRPPGWSCSASSAACSPSSPSRASSGPSPGCWPGPAVRIVRRTRRM